jgi:hypothetical protein
MIVRSDMEGSSACLTLDRNERLLRFALERASFIDTPANEHRAGTLIQKGASCPHGRQRHAGKEVSRKARAR